MSYLLQLHQSQLPLPVALSIAIPVRGKVIVLSRAGQVSNRFRFLLQAVARPAASCELRGAMKLSEVTRDASRRHRSARARPDRYPALRHPGGTRPTHAFVASHLRHVRSFTAS
ncbi:unnamed protein product [Pieris brassicae]|uniref:Uncharacterized protein n=1 Tax=Pieris brassicae TaxID=7116 RepID=A0A9P0X6H7_PIEBR|nr:unnamed protein product [Pieris brassicae]